jgi:membrane fusion protein, copper/silver efflux system
MRKLVLLGLVLGCTVLAFLAGHWRGVHSAAASPAAGGRKALYYVDPMNPAHTSARPGLAPCGMKMEPVYADADAGVALAGVPAVMPPGTVKVSSEWQQRLGIGVAKPQKKPLHDSLRFLGRVAVDEARLYRVIVPTSGWITRALPYATGSPVRKDEVLACIYNPDFLAGVQGMLFYLSGRGRALETTNQARPPRNHMAAMLNVDLEQNMDLLQNMGMGRNQIDKIIATQTFDKNVDIASPADGFILQRNVSEGLRFEKGAELFRIADLRQVWILLDVPEPDAGPLQPGTAVRVQMREGHRTSTLAATVSRALPQFDPVSRTLKVRLDAPNPDVRLKPDMFVDVEVPLTLSEELVVPADAILDSGLRKTVFVERAQGLFEPRAVQIGERCGDQIQILSGLLPEESIAVSGTFLIDSESRLKRAAAQARSATAKDPVCGMEVDEAEARSAALTSPHEGRTCFFCSAACKKRYDATSRPQLSASARSPRHAPEDNLDAPRSK